MPEFEEPEAEPSSKQNYTPSTDASSKPRSRRRSGGFKTTPAPTNSSIGEVDPAEALKKEKLSGREKPEPSPKKEQAAPKAEKPEGRPEKAARPDRGKAQPSPETLAAIERVDARLAERKKERDARRSERGKTRPNKGGKKPGGTQRNPGKQRESGGLIASIKLRADRGDYATEAAFQNAVFVDSLAWFAPWFALTVVMVFVAHRLRFWRARR